MRAFANTLPLERMRMAPMPLIAPLNIEVLTSRSVVVPRGGMLRPVTFCALMLDVEFTTPEGKNWTNAFAADDALLTPRGELLKIVTSVWKFVPPTPCAEPTTGRNTSLLAASVPVAAPPENPLALTPS